jgi:hypothetical protein
MARGGRRNAVILFASAAVLIWAHIGVAALTVCLNESPDLARDLVSALPFADAAARWLLPLFAPFGASAQACDPTAHARALASAGLAYVVAIFALDLACIRGRVVWALVAAAAAVMQLAMLLMPALLSSDIIDYATHGRVASLHGANPYVMTPSQFPADPLSSLGAWPTVVTVYGPLWTQVDAALTGVLPDSNLVRLVFAYKLFALVANLVSVVLIGWLALRWGRSGATHVRPLVAVTMWLWNPLVNLELIGNGHNEAAMLALVVAGLALLTLAIQYRRQQWLWFVGLLTLWLGTLVKFVPAAIETVFAIVWLRSIDGVQGRVLRILALVALLSAVSLAVAAPWLDSPAVAAPLLGLASGGQRFKDVWQDAPAAWLTVRVVPLLGVPDDPATLRMDVARVIVWTVTRGIFVLYVLLEAWRLWRAKNVERAVALASMRVLLLSLLLYTSQVYAWYFLWPLPFACLLGPRNGWSRAVLVFGLTFLPAFYLREFQAYGVFEMPLYAEIGLASLGVMWLIGQLSVGRPKASISPPDRSFASP